MQSVALLSCNELRIPLSLPLRQSLAALIEAHDQGLGPVEREARARRTAGAPMTDREIAALAETHYPAEVRTFLYAHGQQALMREDLARALVASGPVAAPPSGTVAGREAKARPGRSARRRALAAKALRLAVLAAAVAAGGLILHVGLPKIRAEPARPAAAPVPKTVTTPAPVRPPEDSPCRQALRADAAAWCEGALTGTRARGATADATPEGCGDPLEANSDTIRRALNGLLDDGVMGTYRPSDARERCAAAAEQAVP